MSWKHEEGPSEINPPESHNEARTHHTLTPGTLARAAAQLTHRELVCLQWVAEGKSVVQIASHYKRTPDTINHHLKNAYRKLGARGRLQAVVPMIRAGLLPKIDETNAVDWDNAQTPPEHEKAVEYSEMAE